MPSTVADIGLTRLPDYHDFLHVVIAVIENDKGEVLISRRHQHLHQGGLWEFPGGKVEPGEEVFDALRRELKEEVALLPAKARPLIRIPYEYPDRKVLLDVWHVDTYQGEARGAEGQDLVWVKKESLDDYPFPEANKPIVTAVKLPACYLITPDPGHQRHWRSFLQKLEITLSSGISLLQLRAPLLERNSYLKLAKEVHSCCIDYDVKLLLNGDAFLLDECDAAGIHLNSRRLMASETRTIGVNKILAASCHSLREIEQAEWIEADFAVVSPVKQTASHPEAKTIGWQQFHNLSERSSLPLFALGGMTANDLQSAWHYGAQGIAAIRSLWVE